MTTLPKGLVGSFRLSCTVDGCGQSVDLDHPGIPPGWHEADDGAVCPRHSIAVLAVEPPVAELVDLAQREDAQREAARLGAAQRAEREAEVALKEAARRKWLAEVEAKHAAQQARERQLHDELCSGPDGAVWAAKRAKVVLNRIGWRARRADVTKEVGRQWPGLSPDLTKLIVKTAARLQKEDQA